MKLKALLLVSMLGLFSASANAEEVYCSCLDSSGQHLSLRGNQTLSVTITVTPREKAKYSNDFYRAFLDGMATMKCRQAAKTYEVLGQCDGGG